MKINFDKLPKIEKQGLAVDIDETLSNTIEHLIRELQERFGNPENLSTKEIIEKYRYTQNVPYWQSTNALTWIDKEIHSNELQERLPLIKDADLYLDKINKIIPISAYITARPIKVLAGTQKWLNMHKLPKAPIICKPMDIAYENANKWKGEILEKLYPDILGMIDDNAKILDCLNKKYKGIIFLYDHNTISSKKNVVPCKNWLTTYSKIKNHFEK